MLAALITCRARLTEVQRCRLGARRSVREHTVLEHILAPSVEEVTAPSPQRTRQAPRCRRLLTIFLDLLGGGRGGGRHGRSREQQTQLDLW